MRLLAAIAKEYGHADERWDSWIESGVSDEQDKKNAGKVAARYFSEEARPLERVDVYRVHVPEFVAEGEHYEWLAEWLEREEYSAGWHPMEPFVSFERDDMEEVEE